MPPLPISELRRRVDEILPAVCALRHAIHAEPEPALEEHATRKKLLEAIAPLGLEVWQPLLGTDLIAELPGPPGAPAVVLRADIDALPLDERSGVPWASQMPGLMHACGHDGHAAALAGAAMILAPMRESLPCTVRFVFQPGEEVVAAGRDLVARGACDGAQAAFALHCWPGLEAGCVAARTGPMFAASDHFTIGVYGQGGHAAMPSAARNPLPPAAEIVTRLAELHMEVHQSHGEVVTVCSLQAGANSNVIPDAAEILGTMRFLETARGARLEKRLRTIVESVAKRWDVTTRLFNEHNYPLPVVNTPRETDLVRQVADAVLGPQAWREADTPSMGAEDFAFYLQDRPGAIFRLGMGHRSAPVHSAQFDFNDAALAPAILMHTAIALSYGVEPTGAA